MLCKIMLNTRTHVQLIPFRACLIDLHVYASLNANVKVKVNVTERLNRAEPIRTEPNRIKKQKALRRSYSVL